MQAVILSTYLRDNGLESVVSAVDGGDSRWELRVRNGSLIDMKATGVQFFDGEAFDDTVVSVKYEIRDDVRVVAPASVR